ncbi:MAG TPA: hypothetical protein VF423_15175 [Actinomycetes bacterium]
MTTSTAAVAAAGPSFVEGPDRWAIEVLGRQHGLTRVSRDGSGLRVRLGDQVPADHVPTVAPRPSHLGSLLVADLATDGTVTLVARCAPPALVFADGEARLLPNDGSVRATARLRPGDLLVMCSASALEANPAGVVDLLAGPRPARQGDLGDLVRRLLSSSLLGAAAAARFDGP